MPLFAFLDAPREEESKSKGEALTRQRALHSERKEAWRTGAVHKGCQDTSDVLSQIKAEPKTHYVNYGHICRDCVWFSLVFGFAVKTPDTIFA